MPAKDRPARRANDLIASAAKPEADRRGAIAGEILQHASSAFSYRGVLQVAPVDGKTLPMLLTAGLASQHRHDVLRLVGQYGGRFRQSSLRQEESSIGQLHHEKQGRQRDGQTADGCPRIPPALASGGGHHARAKASRPRPAPRQVGLRPAAPPPPHRLSRAAVSDRARGIAERPVRGPHRPRARSRRAESAVASRARRPGGVPAKGSFPVAVS